MTKEQWWKEKKERYVVNTDVSEQKDKRANYCVNRPYRTIHIRYDSSTTEEKSAMPMTMLQRLIEMYPL